MLRMHYEYSSHRVCYISSSSSVMGDLWVAVLLDSFQFILCSKIQDFMNPTATFSSFSPCLCSDVVLVILTCSTTNTNDAGVAT